MKKIAAGLLLSVALLFANVNINSASKQELMELKGIGDKTAAAIIDYRNLHKFRSIEELLKIKGIGKKKLEILKSYIKI